MHSNEVRRTAMSSGERLHSLDALRGFDMFWIMGGGGLLAAMAEGNESSTLDWMAAQTHHVEWNGFTFWDLIFPLFLFIAGVAMPFSLGRRVERGDSPALLRRHVVRRGLTLVLLGLVYNGLLTFDLSNLRWGSVLGRIGLAYLLAGLVFLGTTRRGQALWIVGLLLGYWAAMTWIPVPEFGAGVLEPGRTLADYVDRLLMPGRLYHGDRDPEGLFSTVPAIATALLGAMAGHWLRGPASGARKALGLFLAGLAGLALGGLWHLVFPLNKNLWSSSFVLWTAGWSMLLLSAFYLVIDVWGWRRWTFFFVVIGMNAITIYMLNAFVDFQELANLLLGRSESRLHPAFFIAAGILLRWLVLYGMYRKRWFLRV
jgi:predicted acyltransferase